MSPEPVRVPANGIEIAYESFGDPGDPPVLLVMGLGTQMLAWPDAFCQLLADRGLRVIRFDNRDVGLSTHLRDVPVPRLSDVVLRRCPPPYRIDDLADDTAGLLDALGLGSAHLVGVSMGGFIAQTVALRHPSRVRSLTLMMTSTGSRLVGHAKPKVATRLFRRRVVDDRQGAIDAAVETFRAIGSPGFPFDEDHVREMAGRGFDRAYDVAGYRRQLAAVAVQPNRTRELRRVRVPSVVIHGLHDPLVAATGGLAIARAIPGAQFVGFAGMGHDLPRTLWPRIVEEICAVVARGEKAQHAALS